MLVLRLPAPYSGALPYRGRLQVALLVLVKLKGAPGRVDAFWRALAEATGARTGREEEEEVVDTESSSSSSDSGNESDSDSGKQGEAGRGEGSKDWSSSSSSCSNSSSSSSSRKSVGGDRQHPEMPRNGVSTV